MQAVTSAAGEEGDGPPVIAVGSSAVIDLAVADGDAIPGEMRPTREINSYLDGVHIGTKEAVVPAIDIVPPDAIDILVTEHGRMQPVDEESIRSIAEPARGSTD